MELPKLLKKFTTFKEDGTLLVDLHKISQWQNKMVAKYGNQIDKNGSIWSNFRKQIGCFVLEFTVFAGDTNDHIQIYSDSSIAYLQKYISVLLCFFNGEFETLEDFTNAQK